MKKYTGFLLGWLLASALPLMAGPAAYLDFDPGARPAGMGSAFTSVADDANAPLFNPAGLSLMGLNLTEATVSAGFLPLDRLNDFLGACQQLPPYDYLGFYVNHYQANGLLGFNAIGVPAPATSDLNLAFGGGYARDLGYYFKVGVGASFIYENLAGVNARGFGGLDLGLLYVPSVMEDLTLGASALHLGGFLSWVGGPSEAVAGDYRVGISNRFFEKILLLSYDAEWQGGAPFILLHHFGAEVTPWSFMALRAGLDNGNPTLGATAKFLNYGLDYAYEFNPDGFGDIQRISAGLFF